jgi:D-alanyl-D-alanine dipeptidase
MKCSGITKEVKCLKTQLRDANKINKMIQKRVLCMHANQVLYVPFSFTFEHPTGTLLTICRPDRAAVERTREIAKKIFVEAFATTYRGYHEKSLSNEPIERWLRLKEGLSLEQWLNLTYEGEYVEYQEGKKGFVYLINPDGDLMGWLSHDPVSKEGDVYLSQCALKKELHGRGIAQAAFPFTLEHIHTMFPGIKSVKLIARKVNERADVLYTRAGFIKDEKIDPKMYGDVYDDRYVGYRMKIVPEVRTWQEVFQLSGTFVPLLSDQLIKQYEAYRLGNVPTIADPKIVAIPIQEIGEELIDIKKFNHPRISMLPDPQRPFEGSNFNSGLPTASRMRKGVYIKLERMIEELDTLAPHMGYEAGQISIRVFEGLRDLTTQTRLFEEKLKEIQATSPEMNREALEVETSKWISPVKNNVPPHSTGAAIDIRLWDNKRNDFLDVGSFGVIWGSAENAPTFVDKITSRQKLNRLLCVTAATRAGLTNYPYEHWHYSDGDRYAAYWSGKEAIYGSVV